MILLGLMLAGLCVVLALKLAWIVLMPLMLLCAVAAVIGLLMAGLTLLVIGI